MTEENDRELILRTMETMLEVQLRSVRQMLGEENVDNKIRPKKGSRRMSLVDNIVSILEEKGEPLHVTELVDLLFKDFGRVTERDTVSSALSKKAKQGVLVHQTAPATFELLKNDNSPKV